MNARSTKRLVREGELVAEVNVRLVEAEGDWTPYLSLETRTNWTTCEMRSGRVTSSGRLNSRIAFTVSRR